MKMRDLFFRILSIVAVVEILVMVILGATGMKEGFGKNILDATLLSLLSAPLLYLFVVRIVVRHLSEQAELSKRILGEELELKAAVEKKELGVRLKSLVNNVPGVVYRGFRDWSLSFISAEVRILTGYASEDFTSGAVNWKTIIHPDDIEQVKRSFWKANREKLNTFRVEYRIRNKDGGIRWIEDRRQLFYEGSGTFSHVDGLLLDVTEAKLAEESLHSSQKMIDEIINAIPVRVFWKDRDLIYLGCNSIFARDAGFTDPKDLIGKDDYQMGWREQAELYRADDRQVIESGCSKLLIEEPQTTSEGKNLTLLTSKIPLHNSNG